jgi:hypothetical protein
MRKVWMVFLSLAFLLTLSAFPGLADSKDPEIQMGNTAGNLNQFGYAASSNGWLYFNAGDVLWKMRADGTDRQQISPLNANYINILGDWVYFALTDSGSDSGIYRINTNGTNEQQLLPVELKFETPLCAYGEWLYYLEDETGKLCRMTLDGGKSEQIGDKACNDFFVDGGILYASWMQNEGETAESGCILYALPSLEQTGTYKIFPEFGDGDWLYWYSDDGYKRMSKKDGTVENLTEVTYCLNVMDGIMYHRDMQGQIVGSLNPLAVGYIYAYDPFTGKENRLVEKYCYNFNVTDDWLVYYAYDEADKEMYHFAYQISTQKTIKLVR